MKHTYTVNGMTCESCQQKVTKALQSIEGVTSVSVDRETNQAEIEMNEHISQSVFNKALTKVGHYTISNEKMVKQGDSMKRHKRPLKDFLPIIVIAAVIVLFTTLMVVFVDRSFEFGMRMFMGGFFAIFGAFKVFNLRKFADVYQTYDVVAKRSRFYAYLYPFFEIALALLYFANIGGIYRDIFTFVLMSVSTIGVVQKLRQKEEIPCACLGMVFTLPMTWVTLVEDVLMAVEALIMIILVLLF